MRLLAIAFSVKRRTKDEGRPLLSSILFKVGVYIPFSVRIYSPVNKGLEVLWGGRVNGFCLSVKSYVVGERVMRVEGFLAVTFIKNAVHGHSIHCYKCSCNYEGSYAQSRCVDEVYWGCKYNEWLSNILKVMQ